MTKYKPTKLRIERARKVSEALSEKYGLIEWVPRYNAGEELVYTILSQHTSDVNSERAFKNLMSHFQTLDAVAEANVVDIERVIRSGGLARQKAPRIKRVLNEVKQEVGSFDLSFLMEMPLDAAKKWLTKFNGVGPKTAAIILCFSFGMPAMPVDTHIFRVAKRLKLIGTKINAEKAHERLEPIVPPEEVFQFHMYLIKHGRDTCSARFPRCNECNLEGICPSFGKF
jgi:endonuclease-3